MKKKDIFIGCSSPGFLIIFLILSLAFFSPDPYNNYLYVLFFLITGSLCLYNYKNCGRVHCKITGPLFIVIGVLALLRVMNIVSVTWDLIWIFFWIALIFGFGIEFMEKGKIGVCYDKK
ncbi:MAG: hypothetical protein IH845_03930 [Nanoarchaeota archaeon]|nr:hypothetical protein [Nanoarchaeota archaeon]